ncbi:MAG: phosphatase PAP2 family protein [Saprospiraceae bacterium]|nr:phosphatase PAP2 family protein [Saprospiraceae bacterium]MBL0025719.1 phosphatase PAP2 family protein [Saprospiraceae bacterium]
MNLISWDIKAFEFVNSSLSNSLFDALLPWFREPLFWVPLYVFILGFMIFNFGIKSYWFLIFIILTVSTSDLISSHLVKKSIRRLRPCNTEYVHTIKRVPCGSGFSFTSSHATNHFAIASFLVLTFGQSNRKMRLGIWFWASLISFSQVYVGVHFPLDVLGGALLGIIVGKLYALLFNKYYGHLLKSLQV